MAFFLLHHTNYNFRSYLHTHTHTKTMGKNYETSKGNIADSQDTVFSCGGIPPWPIPHLCSGGLCCQNKFLLLTLEGTRGSREPPCRYITIRHVSWDYSFHLHCLSSRGVLTLSPSSSTPCLRHLQPRSLSVLALEYANPVLPSCCYNEKLCTSKRQIKKNCCEMICLKSDRPLYMKLKGVLLNLSLSFFISKTMNVFHKDGRLK